MTIVVGTVTIDEGETFTSDDGGPVFTFDVFNPSAVLINRGIIRSQNPGLPGGAVGIDGQGQSQTVRNFGLIEVIPARLSAVGISVSHAVVENAGTLTVVSVETEFGNNTAIGIYDADFVANSGTITTTATGAAYGVQLRSPGITGQISVVNTGSIQATSSWSVEAIAAAGVVFDDFYGNVTFSNSGTIDAVTTSNNPSAQSAGLVIFSGRSGGAAPSDPNVVNTGTISGDYSIYSSPANSTASLYILNSNLLDGNVALGWGTDRILNTGTILGSVAMGHGDDLIDNTMGTISGSIDLGDGDDGYLGGVGNEIVRGGLGIDSLSGGGGRDHLSGEDGNDSLNGGDGDDTLLGEAFGHTGVSNDTLSGGAGDDQIHSYFGMDIIDGGDGIDMLTLDRRYFTGNLTLDLTLAPDIVQALGDGSTIAGMEWGLFDAGSGNDRISGGALADVIYGNGGDDELLGGGGDDFIRGGAGSDILWGGDGNDRLFGYLGPLNEPDTLYGEDGDDVLDARDNSTLYGGAGADRLTAISGGLLDGGDGDDYISSGGREATIIGGAGYDRLRFDMSTMFIIGITVDISNPDGPATSTNDGGSIQGIEEIEFYGGHNDDIFIGGNGNDYASGQSGDDILRGGGGDDRLDVRSSDSLDQAFGEDGNDRLSSDFGRAELFGGAGDDIIAGGNLFGEGHGILDGGAGNDHITFSGAFHVDGGEGIDFADIRRDFSSEAYAFTLGSGAALVQLDANSSLTGVEQIRFYAGAGNDTIGGGSFADEIRGGGGLDVLFGFGGDDWLSGGDGDDQIDGGLLNDLLEGQAGDDVLYGADGADVLLGGQNADALFGGDGDDTLAGGTGDDWVDGGLGDDLIEAGSGGANTLIGGEGLDRLVFNGSAPIYLDLAAGAYSYQDGWDGLLSIEGAIGGSGSDVLFGDGNANAFSGQDGADALIGRGGDDMLAGGFGDDWLDGGDGDDVLEGGWGINVLIGGDGVDLASYAAAEWGVWVDMNAGVYSNASVWDVFLESIEGVRGGQGNDTIFGDALANRLEGGLGDDALIGGAGDDVLVGETGADWLVGGDGNDRLIGGDGVDVLTGGAGADIFDLGANAGWDVAFDFNTSEDRFDLGGHVWSGFFVIDADGDGQADDTLLGYAGGNFVALDVAGLTLEEWNALVDGVGAGVSAEKAPHDAELQLLLAGDDDIAFARDGHVVVPLGGDDAGLRGLGPELPSVAPHDDGGWLLG